ncbi:MAG: leucine-rich repeat domain-containing protein, partial [Muribaculaceae bacterium]|nr:leucine-rich repeat domain-containing protein [Muribaculaceae bacterium]
MKKLIMTLLGVLMTLPMFSRDFEFLYKGQRLTYTILDEEACTCQTKAGWEDSTSVNAGHSVGGDVTIPSTVKFEGKDYTVVAIGAYSFYYCDLITSVTLSSSVKEIGSCAFSRCSGLTSFIIPDGVSMIKSGTFSQCTGLTSVSIPDSVTEIGAYAFSTCTGLTSITIPPFV